MRERRKEDVEEDEERAVERISEKQVLWHGDLQGITSCNKVSNCVLLDEYRQNLSAALGHLPEDEGDLEEEEEEGEEGGDGHHQEEEEDKNGECLSNDRGNYEEKE